MVVVLLVVFVSLWSIPTACADERRRIALDVRNGVVTPPSVLASAIREAAEIWAPYGVSVEVVSRGRKPLAPGETVPVPLTFESAHARGHVMPGRTPLGWTGFDHGGQPNVRMSIFYDAITLAASGGLLFGRREVYASRILEERLVGRVLGRTIAHEVGHVLFRSPNHSSSGLMRAAQSVTELQHPSRAGFALDEQEVARLKRALGTTSAVTATRH